LEGLPIKAEQEIVVHGVWTGASRLPVILQNDARGSSPPARTYSE
jgi:hypothetical protein